MILFLDTLGRAIAIILLLLILIRFLGKKQISQLTFADYVFGIAMGSVAGNAAVGNAQASLRGSIILVTWAGVVSLIGYLALKNLDFRRFINSEPLIIIQNGNVLISNMAKAKYNFNNLLMQLRDKNVFDISEVEFAILEPNGTLSVLKKADNLPVTPKDLKIAAPRKGMMQEIILNGELMQDNLPIINRDQAWVMDQLRHKNIPRIEDVVFAGFQTNGELFVVAKDNKQEPN